MPGTDPVCKTPPIQSRTSKLIHKGYSVKVLASPVVLFLPNISEHSVFRREIFLPPGRYDQ